MNYSAFFNNFSAIKFKNIPKKAHNVNEENVTAPIVKVNPPKPTININAIIITFFIDLYDLLSTIFLTPIQAIIQYN